MAQMRWAGYGPKSREIVARRTLGKLDQNMLNLVTLGRPLY